VKERKRGKEAKTPGCSRKKPLSLEKRLRLVKGKKRKAVRAVYTKGSEARKGKQIQLESQTYGEYFKEVPEGVLENAVI